MSTNNRMGFDAGASAEAFVVALLGSHPKHDNDDCWVAEEFATLEQARAAVEDPENWDHDDLSRTMYFEISGARKTEIIRNPRYSPERETDSGEWRREQQMQAAMEFGVQGWNDFEGYDAE